MDLIDDCVNTIFSHCDEESLFVVRITCKRYYAALPAPVIIKLSIGPEESMLVMLKARFYYNNKKWCCRMDYDVPASIRRRVAAACHLSNGGPRAPGKHIVGCIRRNSRFISCVLNMIDNNRAESILAIKPLNW